MRVKMDFKPKSGWEMQLKKLKKKLYANNTE